MTKPVPLYLTEGQVADRLGVSMNDWPSMATLLEARGLPPKNPMFGNRRYWPAVQIFFDRLEGIRAEAKNSEVITSGILPRRRA